MLLEKISEKNNIMTFSSFNVLSPKLSEGKYSVKEDGDILWGFTENKITPVYIQVNFLEPTDIFEIQWKVNDYSLYSSMSISHSLDGLNWYECEKDSEDKWSGYTNLKPKYVRLTFEDVLVGFTLTDFKIYGDETIKPNKELISLTAKKYYPQRFFEQNNLFPKIVYTYLRMLEENICSKTIKKFFASDACVIELDVIFENGGELSNPIDVSPLNELPLNASLASMYSELGAVVINNNISGDVTYDISGVITDFNGTPSSSHVTFFSSVSCDGSSCSEALDISDAVYRWNFDDEYSSWILNNDNIKVIDETGEEFHNFTRLGTYNVLFTMVINDVDISKQIPVTIAPLPIFITGNYSASDGEVYTIHNLTSWRKNQPESNYGYIQPTVVLRDVNNTPTAATLTDNGDRTFTLHDNGFSGECKIIAYDDYYENWVEYEIEISAALPLNVLLDTPNDPILDSGGNYITTN